MLAMVVGSNPTRSIFIYYKVTVLNPAHYRSLSDRMSSNALANQKKNSMKRLTFLESYVSVPLYARDKLKEFIHIKNWC
jgi:hypothetical protein